MLKDNYNSFVSDICGLLFALFCFVLFSDDTDKDPVQVFLTSGVENNYTFVTQGNKIAVS